MPAEQLWDTFFNPDELIEKIGIDHQVKTLIDIGCGYGTFLLPMAEVVSNKVIGIDIDPAMIAICRSKIAAQQASKIELINGDISDEDTVRRMKNDQGDIDFITLFNILHCEEPFTLLKNVYDLLNVNGRMAITHWKYEDTPRGPSMEIRPKPEMIIKWATNAGFTLAQQVELPPYHYGLVFLKK